MAFASSQLSFLTRTPLSLPPKHNRKPPLKPLVSSSCSMDKDALSEKGEVKLAKLAMVALAAGTLTLGSVESAVAAKSGGRIGGQAFRSAAPWVSGARINNSRTSIYVNPPVAPPLIGGYGYAVLYYGGWGWSPFTFFMPGPSIAVGVGGGFEVLIAFLVFGAVTAIIRGLFGRRDYEEDDY